MKNKFLLFGVIALLTACGHSPDELSEKREMFDAGLQKVITSFADPKQGTMSILYGNSAARQDVLESAGNIPGEVFTLATWHQIANPRWYGTYINGRVKTVETVSILPSLHDNVAVVYHLVKGSAPGDKRGNVISSRDRINFILSLKPSVFP